jgi:hypothetical protein
MQTTYSKGHLMSNAWSKAKTKKQVQCPHRKASELKSSNLNEDILISTSAQLTSTYHGNPTSDRN